MIAQDFVPQGNFVREWHFIHTPDRTKFPCGTKDRRGRASIYETSGIGHQAKIDLSAADEPDPLLQPTNPELLPPLHPKKLFGPRQL
jgi:hypothetical protein